MDVVQDIYQTAQMIPEPYSSLSRKEKRLARKLLDRLDKAEAKHGPLPHSDILRPMLLSKNGRLEEALELTEQQYQSNPTWDSAIAVANAARRMGNLEYAVKMFAAGAGHDPDDETCFLEIGDIYLEQDRWADALEAYDKALEKDAEHQWALPSAFYCRHKLGVPGRWFDSLREVAEQEGCTCGMEDCLTSIFGGYSASRGAARAQYLLGR